jgi:hypothetical protein
MVKAARDRRHCAADVTRRRLNTMNVWLLSAGGLAIIVGAVHSLLGERMIFRLDVRESGVSGRYRGILRASWHATTLFGWALAAVMLQGALSPSPLPPAVRISIVAAMGLAAGAVLWWTRGRHPGWIGLLAVAVLCALA